LQVHHVELELQNEELRRTQIELEKMRDSYHDLYESAPAGYLTVDPLSLVLQANLAASALLGVHRRVLLRQKLTNFMHRTDARTFMTHLNGARTTGKKQSCSIRLIRADRTRVPVQLECVAVGAPKGVGHEYRLVLVDITQQERLREVVTKARDELEHCVAKRTEELTVTNAHLMAEIEEHRRLEADRAQLIAQLERRNAEVEGFAYTVSHDLKSPLFTIMGFLERLRKDVAAQDSAASALDFGRIQAAGERMRAIIDELLALSRVGTIANAPEDVPLADLAREAVEQVSGKIVERGVSVTISPDLPVVRGDRRRLFELLETLVENAVKFMGDQENPLVEIGVRGGPDAPTCFVRDNGIGIGAHFHQKVFGVFEQLNPDLGGSGMGLTIAKRVVETLGGRIWVESEGPGRGSTFCFVLGAGCAPLGSAPPAPTTAHSTGA
jgi:signal transduction histidine kinase